jgi:hypothetical protein
VTLKEGLDESVIVEIDGEEMLAFLAELDREVTPFDNRSAELFQVMTARFGVFFKVFFACIWSRSPLSGASSPLGHKG